MLKCPECGNPLVLSVDETITVSKKILKNGNLHKVTNRTTKGKVTSAPYLYCEKCAFSYDIEHASGDKTIEAFDDWITKHLDEIYELN